MYASGDCFLGFKRHLRTALVPGEAAYLLSARGVTALRGRHFEVLAPLLDGSRTRDTLVCEVAPELTAAEVEVVLGRLGDANLLTYRDEIFAQPPDADEAYWDLAGLDGAAARSTVATSPVEIVAVGDVEAAAVARACRESGLAVYPSPAREDTAHDDALLDYTALEYTASAYTGHEHTAYEHAGSGAAARPRDSRAAFAIVVCDDYLAPELAAVDARQRLLGRPWLLARPCGPQPWIGPIFRPGEGPCWACLAHRVSGHRRAELPARRAVGGAVRYPEASIAAARAAAIHFTVLEAAKWLAGVRHPDQDGVYTFDTLTLHGSRHPVTRRPQCPRCGDPGLVAARVNAPVRIDRRPKAAAAGNGHRATAPEETYARYRHLIGPVTGIVSDLRRAPGVPGFVESFVSGPNLALSADTLDGLNALLRGHSGGKGVTPIEARVGALCEAVERYCAVRQGDEPVVHGSYRALAGEAVHPDSCQLFDPRQFAGRAAWNSGRPAEQQVCEPFDERERREWTPVWSLTENRRRLLPTAMLYFHGARPGYSPQLFADSNGNAAGSCPEDAIVQGFLELVERDAVALWWYNRTVHQSIDLDDFADPWVDRMREAYRGVGRELWALDLTSDLQIPVVVALSARREAASPRPARPGPVRVACGFGAHFDPRIALRRAVAEMGQLFGAVLGSEPDTGADPGLRAWWAALESRPAPHLLPGPADPRTAASYGYAPRPDFSQDIAEIVRLLGGRGLDLLVLDQTRPDVGTPVVKVLVPGLRPLRPRFAPGRLFDVPVALGRLAAPTPYRSLNPVQLPV